MPILTVGKTHIPYVLKRFGFGERARITVTPEMVEVIVPEGTLDEQIDGALHRRRAWIFEQHIRMQEAAANIPSIHRFRSGSKIPYRGRMIRLQVVPTDDSLVHVSYRNGFLIECPTSLPESTRDILIEDALNLWLKKRLRLDIAQFVRRHGEPNGLVPKDFRIKDQKHLWGSCGQDRIINLNWHLIFAPKTVLEYAVAHELCHLQHRKHNRSFWGLVAFIVPDFEARKTWLQRNENLLTVRRIEPTMT
ncbi:M48 family metallopeptidase [Magnetospira sp. QH-2]|uniref:M48 family metallopeptidase n=1 Tax=Magnetospira sp. (strain QH-2) TaxID=1288970 RepID=UPI0003E81758|nr:SprT family zinc-dependent metalloprotease [Magnetospira sp. QH-2]CCQ72763.1 conserved protein of unknown function [Magnetospira sp. QH-2]